MEFPPAFVQRMRDQGLDPDSLYSSRTRKSIRFVSRQNPEVAHLVHGLEKVKWWPSAYWIDDVRTFSKKKEFKRGLYYIQDPVSILPVLAMDLKGKILDMCAAPGTKSVMISELSGERIFVNDSCASRIRILEMNLRKYGCNYQLSRKSGLELAGRYDSILVDAPCSGEGMVNKKDKVFSLWSESRVKRLAVRQAELLKHACSMLNSGGSVVYSTCTFESEENESVVECVAKETGTAVEKLSFKNVRYESSDFGVRIYPWHNNTGGFFIAKLRKE